jgi:ribosomal protein S18 acetylase RimI-like enzyme
MPSALKRLPFGPDDVRAVQGFHCGDEPWEQEVAEWIKGHGADNALTHIQRGGYVWLYVNDDGDIVGYGSIGRSRWAWPTKKDKPRPVAIVPSFGVQDHFKGKPDDAPRGSRYADVILRDLINEATIRLVYARSQGEDAAPILSLFVHPQNNRAKVFYQRAGFQPFFRSFTDNATGITYESMVLRLPD